MTKTEKALTFVIVLILIIAALGIFGIVSLKKENDKLKSELLEAPEIVEVTKYVQRETVYYFSEDDFIMITSTADGAEVEVFTNIDEPSPVLFKAIYQEDGNDNVYKVRGGYESIDDYNPDE